MPQDYESTNDLEVSAQEIGEKLRKARETQGLTIEDIQQRTKLRRKYIQAIEKGDFNVFPGNVYVKGAMRNFAEAVGCDYEELWANYEKWVSKHQDQEASKSKSKAPKYYSPSPHKAPPWRRMLKKLIMYVLIIGMLGFGMVQVYDFLAGIELGNDEPVAENDLEIPEKEEDPEEKEDDDPQDKEKEEPPELSAERVSETPYTYRITGLEEEELTIVLSAEHTCWVGATLDGEYEDLGNIEAGTSVELTTTESAEFILGYAYGLEISVNDTALEVPDERGRAEVHIEIAE